MANAFVKVIDTYDEVSWDGFSESQRGVLDEEGFWIDFTLTDGTRVHASGDNAFPEHYFDAMGEMWDILMRTTEEEVGMKLYIGDTEVPVTWEENASVEELKSLLPLTIQMYSGNQIEVFSKLQELSTLQYIAAPYASFKPVDAVQPTVWTVGSASSYHFCLFGFIPFGTHTIIIERFDRDGIRSREGNEHVSVWNHKIYLKDKDGQTEYTDEVDIDAGWKTVFIRLWAKAFYSHRQRKWRKLIEQEKCK